tara:strand:+ start:396 stop:524 length:129 start_codon:yes stop_codon:yes gene_type:complete
MLESKRPKKFPLPTLSDDEATELLRHKAAAKLRVQARPSPAP